MVEPGDPVVRWSDLTGGKLEIKEIQDIAPSGSFLCNQLEFIVPDINFQFHGVKTYTLGAG
jgi:hypothetical protein